MGYLPVYKTPLDCVPACKACVSLCVCVWWGDVSASACGCVCECVYSIEGPAVRLSLARASSDNRFVSHHPSERVLLALFFMLQVFPAYIESARRCRKFSPYM